MQVHGVGYKKLSYHRGTARCIVLCTKIDELSVMFNSNRVDNAVLTETWLYNGIMDNLIHIPGYCVHRLDRRDGRQGGGIAVC